MVPCRVGTHACCPIHVRICDGVTSCQSQRARADMSFISGARGEKCPHMLAIAPDCPCAICACLPMVECKLRSGNHVGQSEIASRDVYLLAKIHEIHHTKIHEDTLAAHIGRRYTFFGIQEALFRIEELHTRVLSGSKNFTPAGGPSKRLPRPPRDPWRRGNKEVSRARCALCAPAYAPPRAPSVRRIDPPRAHCCPHCAQANALNVIGRDTKLDTKSTWSLGD